MTPGVRPAATTVRCLLAALLCIPFVAAPDSFLFPFVVPKALCLQTIALAMAAAYAAGRLSGELPSRRVDRVTASLAVLCGVFALTALAGNDVGRSVWDSLERSFGLPVMLSAVLVHRVVSAVIVDEREKRGWLLAAVCSVVPVAVIAVLQSRGFDVGGPSVDGRPSAMLGHPAFAGAMGVFGVFAGLTLMVRRPPRVVTALTVVSMVAGVAMIVVAEARAAVVAVAAGALAVGGMVALLSPRGGRPRRVAEWCLSGLVFASALLVLAAKSSWGRSLPLVRRISVISPEAAGVDIRLRAWRIALDGWTEHPLLGWGPGAFRDAFEAAYPPELLHHGPTSTWVDDAHSVFLNALAEQGLVGAGALVAVFLVVLAEAWRLRREAPGLAAAITGFVVAHAVDKSLAFEGVVSWSHLIVFCALSLPAPHVTQHAPSPRRRMATGAVAIVAAVAVWCGATLPTALAAMGGRDAIGAVVRGDASALETLDRATRAAPQFAPEIQRHFATAVAATLPRIVRAGRPELAERLALETRARLAIDERDVRPLLERVRLLLASPAPRDESAEIATLHAALSAARQRFPRRQQIAFALADVRLLTDDRVGSRALLEEARDLAPTVGEPWLRLIAWHVSAGKPRAARRLRREAEQAGARFSAQQGQQLDALVR